MNAQANRIQRADLNRIEALVREELDSQRQLLELLDVQQKAVVARTSDALEVCTQRVEELLASSAARRQRRETLVRRMAQTLGLAPSALTLGSLAERAGQDGERLGALRQELRSVVAEVVRANRRLSAAVAVHRKINSQVIELTLGDDEAIRSGAAPLGAGSLIDAEV